LPDPFALLPIVAASGGGRIDAYDASQLVAAGFTLLQRSSALVRALAGRRSAILLPTSPQYLVALAASDGRGAVLVNPLAAPAEIAHQLRDANVGAVLTIQSLAKKLPEGVPVALLDDAPRRARVIVDGVGREVDLGSHVGLTVEGLDGAAGSDEEAAIVYTSAMQGTPLGAVLTHRNLVANARSAVIGCGNVSQDRVLALLPYAHLFGLSVTCTAALIAGAQVITMGRFNPARAVELLETDGITELVGVPAVFKAMLAIADRGAGRIDCNLRVSLCGGAELPVELQHRWADATGCELRQGYGLTEGGPVCLFNRVDIPNVIGSLGVHFPDVDVRIADTVHGETANGPDFLRAGDEGEIVVRGDNVFRGYVSNGEQGLRLENGWLRTGDRGVMREDGHVRFLGLIKPMFTRSGFNIYPREIERAICELPGVRRVVVSAIPEPARENDIALEVDGSVTADEVKRWCESRLASYKQPARVIVRS
jgi:long-chain acyl-CoA synthetase